MIKRQTMINKTEHRKLIIEQDKLKGNTNVMFSATFARRSFEDKINRNQWLVILIIGTLDMIPLMWGRW